MAGDESLQLDACSINYDRVVADQARYQVGETTILQNGLGFGLDCPIDLVRDASFEETTIHRRQGLNRLMLARSRNDTECKDDERRTDDRSEVDEHRSS